MPQLHRGDDLDSTSGKLSSFGGEETEETRGRHELRLDTFCTPIDICSLPTDRYANDFDAGEFSGSKYATDTSIAADDGGKGARTQPVDDVQYFAPNGIIFAGDIDDFDNDPNGLRPKMDFIIGGLRNDVALDVFLVYNKALAAPGANDALGPLRGGSIDIPIDDDLKFITAVHLKPIGPALSTGGAELSGPLGEAERNVRSAVLSVSLADLTDAVARGELPSELYFQVLAVPVDPAAPVLDFSLAQASAPELFKIHVPSFDAQGNETDNGTKGGTLSRQQSESGSKSNGGSTGTDGGTGGDTGGK